VREIKAIIADDNESFIAHLETLLSDVWPSLVICDRAKSGPEALELIQKHKPHLAFLEVRIPGICGMQVARRIAGSCWVVFITAYDRYAVNAFETGAVDYLVKPVNRDRLEKAVNRLKKQLTGSSSPPPYLSQIVEQVMAHASERLAQHYLQWLRVQRGDTVLLVPVEEVCYFRASDKYTLVVTKEGESLIKKPIKELADELDPNKYWRIHRGAIVNVSQIDKVSRSVTGRGSVKLRDRQEILTVSRAYLHIFKQM
jgi:DNA-binding LytR/AlgR family response regulator